MHTHFCLFCNSPLTALFVDLGVSPPSNAFLTAEQCNDSEIFYPLQAYVCSNCLLVQGPHYKRPQEIFNHDYVYHSSWSKSWVNHAKNYIIDISHKLNLNSKSLIIEIGSNDGYLLQHAMALGIPCIGIDPCTGAASIAQAKGIFTITDFFNTHLARQLVDQNKKADLICGINVLAHIPNINDFIMGMKLVLKPNGIITMEFPHLLRLVNEVQFDTIYHEHYFYYTLTVICKMFAANDLRIFDVEELSTHGGSLRIYVCHKNSGYLLKPTVQKVLDNEQQVGMLELSFYENFQNKIAKIRYALMSFLLDAAANNKSVVGFGAAAKGNTLINYFGINKELLSFVADSSPIKQGLFLPGSRIPVVSEQALKDRKPDYVLILPWNLKQEISEQLHYITEWGGKFVVAIPELQIW